MTTSTINHLSLSWSLLPLLRWARVRWVYLRDGHHCPTNIPDRHMWFSLVVRAYTWNIYKVNMNRDRQYFVLKIQNAKSRLQGDEDWSTLHSTAGQTHSAHKRTGCWVLEMIIIIMGSATAPVLSPYARYAIAAVLVVGTLTMSKHFGCCFVFVPFQLLGCLVTLMGGF